MKNGNFVKDNLVGLIAKIGRKLLLEEQISLVILMGLIFSMFILLQKKE